MWETVTVITLKMKLSHSYLLSRVKDYEIQFAQHLALPLGILIVEQETQHAKCNI